MKNVIYLFIGLSMLAVSCEDIPTAGKFAVSTAYVEIIGDSTKQVAVSYNSIIDENGESQNENHEVTQTLTIPSRFTIKLALNGKSLKEKDLCFLKLKSDGNINVKAILISESAKFNNNCPIWYSFYADDIGKGMAECDKYIVGSDSLITLLKSKGYPCIIELTEGQNEGYVTTSDISNTGIY